VTSRLGTGKRLTLFYSVPFKLIFFLGFQEVEYLAYFCPAQYVYRVDRPKETHPVGRD
jgi:hypothetical protein